MINRKRYVKFATQRSSVRSSGAGFPAKELQWLLRVALKAPDSLHLVRCGRDTAPIRPGIHHHDGWELFCILDGKMRFELAGRPDCNFGKGSVIIVPPECLHNASGPQPKNMKMFVLEMLNPTGCCSSTTVGGTQISTYTSFSADQFARWTELLGETPSRIAERAAQLLGKGEWCRQHALGIMRSLFASYAEACSLEKERRNPDELRVSQAISFLNSNYYRADLSLPDVAGHVGLSVSRLSGLFRTVAGSTVQQTLIDIRLRRAMTLLGEFKYSIKEVSAMTGWSNQLYFSAAFRRRFKRPPSQFRRAQEDV